MKSKTNLLVPLLMLSTGCGSLSPEAAAAIGALVGTGGTYVVTSYIGDKMRCGDLHRFTLRGFDAGFQGIGPLSAHVGINEKLLVERAEAADINFANAISVSCYLIDRYPKDDDIQAYTLKILEAASAPKIALEAAAAQAGVPLASRPIAEELVKQFPRFAAELKAHVDSVRAATIANPHATLLKAFADNADQERVIRYYLRVMMDDSPRLTATHHAVQTLLTTVGTLKADLDSQRVKADTLAKEVSKLQIATASGLTGVTRLAFLEPVATTEILFPVNSSVAPDTAILRIRQWASAYREPRFSFSVVGQADPQGNPSHNHRLSEARAQFVRGVLIEHAGIPSIRIALSGIGAGTLHGGPPDNPAMRRVRITVHGAK